MNNAFRERLRPTHGFTLIELLAVIAIIALLATILIAVTGNMRSAARRAQCLSNMRQLGFALRQYADEHQGYLPGTAHLRVEDSWVLSLRSYLGEVDEVRLCPADPRVEDMQEVDWATSYLMNDLIFLPRYDEFGNATGGDYRRVDLLDAPSRTMIAFEGSGNRGIAPSEDHTHAGGWANNWQALLQDIAPDRHRADARSESRTQGSANYLFADFHVESIPAGEIRRRIMAGENIALPPGAQP